MIASPMSRCTSVVACIDSCHCRWSVSDGVDDRVFSMGGISRTSIGARDR